MVKALLFFKITSSLYPFLPRPPIGPRTSPIGKRREKRKTLGRSGFTKPHSGKHPSSVCYVKTSVFRGRQSSCQQGPVGSQLSSG